ncbi:MAG: enoyl-CoA hydratase/isomerase family protein [Anaerolineales bacterium]|nr:enoyl-CoA hydratase/isomerase family protein [Anaerolineales bacterium]
MAEDIILTNLKDGVLTVTLNRPKANAFTTEMSQALTKVFRDAGRNDAVRVVLLAGAGKLFSAGQDVSEFGEGEHVSFRKHLLKTYNPLIVEMRRLEKPVIGAIHGAVAGAALGIALACDLRIAADNARFVVGFSGIGLAPDSAVSLMLPLLIGLGRAAEAAFMNQPISAEQALAWGLVNRVVSVEELPTASVVWASELAKGPVHAMGYTKRGFNKAVLANLEEVLDYEAHVQEIAGNGGDHREGLGAFREKREAKYV